MAQRIIIRHLNGSKTNQIEEFPIQHVHEIVFGREAGVTVLYDPDRDDLVSRQHCRIAPDPAAPEAYVLSDLNSRNGTFLNQRRVFGTTRISHGDVVQFGPGGPEFRFELDPPPSVAGQPRPTRLASDVATSTMRPAPPTRDATTSGIPLGMTPPGMTPTAAPTDGRSRPVGKRTVELMLGDVVRSMKGDSNRAMMIGVVSLAALLVLGGGVYAYMRVVNAEQRNLEHTTQAAVTEVAGLRQDVQQGTAAAEAARQAAETAPRRPSSEGTGTEKPQGIFRHAIDPLVSWLTPTPKNPLPVNDPPPAPKPPEPPTTPVAPTPVAAVANPTADPPETIAAGPRTLTPDEIYAKSVDAVVYVEAAWKLIDTTTGRQVYQFYAPNEYTIVEHHFFGNHIETAQHFPDIAAKYVPVYMKDGDTVRPVLTNTDDGGKNKPIGGQQIGSGFVVSPDGLILTCRDVVSAWESTYVWNSADSPGLIVDPDGSYIDELHSNKDLPRDWMPAGDTSSFWESVSYDAKSKKLLSTGSRARPLEGRLDFLNVTFAKTRQRTRAQLVRSSDQHDAALIKVSLGVPLTAVDLNDNYQTIRVGEAATALGFLSSGPDTFAGTASRDSSTKVIPDPTTSVGNVAKIFRNNGPIDGVDYLDSEFGDSYRLGLNGGGHGFTGGPVFDGHGQVIAIFYGGRASAPTVSFGVPIRYGKDLLSNARASQ
jgi:S1-C subfamily serine protease